MTRLSPRHPRYRSLRTRMALAQAAGTGVVVPEGLIAHGRGEAFDYFLGERTTPSAARAEKAAAAWLLSAKHPVISVNGNVAALASRGVAALSNAVPGLAVEVNLFHRTPARARSIERRLQEAGVRTVLGVRPTALLPGLPSDRARVDRRGIYRADVCLVPLEDGDRAAALRSRGVRVIAIDLNPLSRTARTAHLPIVDELTRALAGITRAAREMRTSGTRPTFVRVAPARWLSDARRAMERGLRAAATTAGRPGSRRASRPRNRGTGRPTRRRR